MAPSTGRSAGTPRAPAAWRTWLGTANAGGVATPETTSAFIDTPAGLGSFEGDVMRRAWRMSATVGWLKGEITQACKRAMLRLGIVPPPLRIQLDVTDGCNFQCPTCSKSGMTPSSKELEADQWTQVLTRVRAVPLLREISVSGGEPLTKPGIFEILRVAKDLDLRVVLLSNGWLLDRHSMRMLEELEVDHLMVSLNSLRESIHDESRGQAGSYQRIMDLIELWRSGPRRTALSIATIVMEPNCRELVSLATFAAEKGLRGIMFQVLLPDEAHYAFRRDSVMPAGEADLHGSDSRWVRDTDVLRAEIKTLLRIQRVNGGVINPAPQLRRFPPYYEDPTAVGDWPCVGTLSRLYIDPFGDMRLCYGFPPIGNALRDSPRQAWRSARAAEIRDMTRRCTRLCRMMNSSM